MGKLLAIDGLNLVRRVYEANAEPDSPEKAASAVRNAVLSFRRLLETHHPTHVLIAFDHHRQSWRTDILPTYRQNRATPPADLSASLLELIDRLTAQGLAVVSAEGAEADDVIATAVLRWMGERRGEAIVVSTNKDLLPLVAQGVRVWDHFRNEWHDRSWVEQRYGVPPEMLADLLALVGNAADGIPGIERVGEKTAARLLRQYKDLDGVMAGAGILLDPLGQRLRAGREHAYLSRELVRPKCDVRLGVTWRMLRYPPDGES